MVTAIFSAEKMLQKYNNYLTYANKLLFFCLNAIFCTYFLTYRVLLVCCDVRNRRKGTPKKEQAQRFCPLRPN